MDSKSGPPKYMRYVPAQNGAQPKVIRMVEAQKDPFEPSRFKINQKVPVAPPSPPAPILHSPPRKVTAEEQKNWKIPPAVSGWKNPRGYTIALDKRCAFNGHYGAEPEIVNSKFGQLTSAFEKSISLHKEELEQRAKSEKLMAQKEKEKNEEKLRLLAQQAREEREAMNRGLGHHRDDDDEDDDAIDDEERRERDKIQNERHRERIRNANIKARNPNSRTKFDRMRDRDISEQIALGMAKPNDAEYDIHDQRLYNQAEGLTTGFGDDDDYSVYDKAWKSQASFSTSYRPSDALLKQSNVEEVQDDDLNRTKKVEATHDPLAPIQFEKDDVEDVFNVESFLKKAKYNARKMQQDQSGSSKRSKRD